MSNNSVTLRRTELDSGIVELLEESNLPTDELRKDKTLFVEAVQNNDRIGIGALQVENSVGLLRSLTVKESYRGEGYGPRLVEALIDSANKRNLDALYLLTTEAASFFKRLGFEELNREQLPAAIQSTRQVQSLCPNSATCMYLNLSETA